MTGNGAALVEFIGYTGPISVGHDVTLKGTSPEAQAYGGYDICDTTIGHDLSITGVQLAYEIEVGDVGPQDNEFCSYPTAMPTSVGHDLTVSNTTTGKVDVGNNTVGHDLAASNNTASTSTGDTGDVGVGRQQRQPRRHLQGQLAGFRRTGRRTARTTSATRTTAAGSTKPQCTGRSARAGRCL